jgi:16S rRNA (guanine966-N2)-methyltransferase
MRIIAGDWGGRTLLSPRGKVRPTQDRVRQVLFDILGGAILQGPVLDLYAGSGALGLEALSRGAPRAVFVESDERIRRVLLENCRLLEAEERCRVLGLRVGRALGLLEAEGARFRWILADPPYGDPETLPLLERLGEPQCRLLEGGGGFVLENRKDAAVPAVCGRLRATRRRELGETCLTFFQAEKDVPGQDAAEGQEGGTE